ncbi:MAG TPA: histidinol-phosphate transaminase [Myxococcota bacterium]|nr:histidinol-phosphate transaminase [Myxococcota bacterium]
MEARKNHPLLDPMPMISQRVKHLKPYDPVSSLDTINQHPEISHFKLDWNETTVPPSPRVTEALVGYLNNGSKLQWYPKMHDKALFEKIADYVGCQASQLIVTNGSDDALDLICQTYLDAEDNVVTPVPTYNHFIQFAERTGARVKKVLGDNPLVPSLKDVSRSVDGNTKVIYLVNPNNPTGNLYSPAEVLQLALRHPQCLIISDEAYFEFAGISCARLVDEIDNIVVTRSFSKCFGLAGMRIGYLVASDTVIGDLRRVHNPKSVNMLAQIAAIAALDDLPYYKSYIRSVKRSAIMVERFCNEREIPCWPTYANFILLRFDDASSMAKKLAEIGVHVRDRSTQIPGMIRIGLGTEEQTREVLARLDSILQEN